LHLHAAEKIHIAFSAFNVDAANAADKASGRHSF